MTSPYLCRTQSSLPVHELIRGAAEMRNRAVRERDQYPAHAAWCDQRANTLEAQAFMAGAL